MAGKRLASFKANFRSRREIDIIGKPSFHQKPVDNGNRLAGGELVFLPACCARPAPSTFSAFSFLTHLTSDSRYRKAGSYVNMRPATMLVSAGPFRRQSREWSPETPKNT